MKRKLTMIALAMAAGLLAGAAAAETGADVFTAGHPGLGEWLLPERPPFPDGNEPTPARVELGKKLYFDPRLSGDGNMSCGTCHNPALGWSDALPTARGAKSRVLDRASPTIVNAAYNSIQMWDGRKASLEDQAMGPMEASAEMNIDTARLFEWLNGNAEYRALFARAYPGEAIDAKTLSQAIASFERTVISSNSPFDRWLKGEATAMTEQQVDGFKLFTGKARCSVCHAAPNFTDNGFHNLGLPSYGKADPDLGRFAQKPVKRLRGAFKTPTLRDVERTAPYFHDGSAATLMAVVEHYDRGGVVKNDLSPDVQPLNLTPREKEDLVAFMKALTSPFVAVAIPELPAN